jgi:hypothetical protein
MGVQRAGIDIGALRELEVFLLAEAFRLSELKADAGDGRDDVMAFPGHPGRHAGHMQRWHGEQQGG